MTPWLRATVLAILVGASAAALPQAGRAYGAEAPPLSSASAPDRRAVDSVPLHGPLRAAVSTPASTTRSPASVPAHETLPKDTQPHSTGIPPHASPGSSPAGTLSGPVPARGPRHPASPSAVPPRPPGGHGPERASPSPSLAPSPSATPSRAGSRAGEGRERPGREDPAAENTDADADGTDVGSTASGGTDSGGTDSAGTGSGDSDLTAVSEAPPQTAVARPSRPAERPVAGPKVFILPLGTGLVLVGLGLGLALFALRLRRG